uniref:Uncharacterized protein n=1 Tax=Arundo donax TaxID=35708 RepID=A0A0A9FZ26_ARUDO
MIMKVESFLKKKLNRFQQRTENREHLFCGYGSPSLNVRGLIVQAPVKFLKCCFMWTEISFF